MSKENSNSSYYLDGLNEALMLQKWQRYFEELAKPTDKSLKELWTKNTNFTLFFYSEFLDRRISAQRKKPGESYKEAKSDTNTFKELYPYFIDKLKKVKQFKNPQDNPNLRIKRDQFFKIFQSFLSVDYLVPDDLYDIEEHFKCLLFYYRTFEGICEKIPLDIWIRVDSATSQLVSSILQTSLQIDSFLSKKDGARIRNKGLSEKVAKNKQLVIEEYCTIDERTSISLNSLALKTKEQLEEKYPSAKISSVQTITRIIKEERARRMESNLL